MTDEVEEELSILECLEDYHRILTNTARNLSGSVGATKRGVAALRADMVKQLIDRIHEVEAEEAPRADVPLQLS